MSFVIPSWIKITLLIVGIILYVMMTALLYLLIVGADQRRIYMEENRKDENHG